MSARFGRKLDQNHNDLVRILEAMGAEVETIQGRAGTPDICVRIFGVERLAEVKMPKEDLNTAQVKWWGEWGRGATILRNAADCEALVSEMRGLMSSSEVSRG